MPAQTDFISDFLDMTEGLRSPLLFRKWSAIACMAGALERRVWTSTSAGGIFGNLYVLLVAPPGVGKFVVESARELMGLVREPGTKLPAFKIASDSVTNASLMDELAKAKSVRLMPAGAPYCYHSLFAAAEEFQLLLPSYDQQFIASLNSMFNNKALHRETRRTGSVRELTIENPQINILAGAQPAYFVSTFPEEAWNTGLIRRIIMIYSTETSKRSLWEEIASPEVARVRCLSALAEASQLFGKAGWTPEAARAIDEWQLSGPAGQGGPPVPKHSKLQHYVRSRTVFAIKLALISALSRRRHLVIEEIDVKRGIEWLLEAEFAMPDIFREMVGRSDSQVIEETYLYAMELWAKGKQKIQVPGAKLRAFLLQRVPSERAEGILKGMVGAGLLSQPQAPLELFKPMPRDVSEIRE